MNQKTMCLVTRMLIKNKLLIILRQIYLILSTFFKIINYESVEVFYGNCFSGNLVKQLCCNER